MKITNKYIESLKPCEDRKANYLEHYKGASHSIVEFLSLDKISYSDKLWVWHQFTTKEVALEFSILCAESVLHIFEKKYPNDDRPRKAIESARLSIVKSRDENKQDAYADDAAANAANAANATANATANAAATYAAAAAYDDDDDDDPAAYAAASYANVVYATAAASHGVARQEQEEKNLQFLIEIYKRKSK